MILIILKMLLGCFLDKLLKLFIFLVFLLNFLWGFYLLLSLILFLCLLSIIRLLFRVLILILYVKKLLLFLFYLPILLKHNFIFLISLHEFLFLEIIFKPQKFFENFNGHFLIIISSHVTPTFDWTLHNKHRLLIILISNNAINKFLFPSCHSHKWRKINTINTFICNENHIFFLWIASF